MAKARPRIRNNRAGTSLGVLFQLFRQRNLHPQILRRRQRLAASAVNPVEHFFGAVDFLLQAAFLPLDGFRQQPGRRRAGFGQNFPCPFLRLLAFSRRRPHLLSRLRFC